MVYSHLLLLNVKAQCKNNKCTFKSCHLFLFMESKNKTTRVIISYFHNWDFDIMQAAETKAAENASGPDASKQGREPTASFTLFTWYHRPGKISSILVLQLTQSQSVVLSIRDTSRAAIHTFWGLWFLTEADRWCLRDHNKQPNSDTCFDTSLICVIRLTDEDHLHLFSIYLLMLHTVYISPIPANLKVSRSVFPFVGCKGSCLCLKLTLDMLNTPVFKEPPKHLICTLSSLLLLS